MPIRSLSLFCDFSKNIKSIKNTAPNNVAFTFVSKSKGKETPKLSASVNASLTRPLHCLLILPTFSPEPELRTSNSTSPKQLKVQMGPSILKTGLPLASLIVNCGAHSDQSCSIVPITVPGGLCTWFEIQVKMRSHFVI